MTTHDDTVQQHHAAHQARHVSQVLTRAGSTMRTRTTLGPKISGENLRPSKNFLSFKILGIWCLSRQFERLTWYKWTFDVRM